MAWLKVLSLQMRPGFGEKLVFYSLFVILILVFKNENKFTKYAAKRTLAITVSEVLASYTLLNKRDHR